MTLRPTTDPDDVQWMVDVEPYGVFSHLVRDGDGAAGVLVPVEGQARGGDVER